MMPVVEAGATAATLGHNKNNHQKNLREVIEGGN
jgi:hypothetical protein